MKALGFSLLAIALLAVATQAQDEQLALYLKSGDILTGNVKKVDEDGIKLDIGDGIELFVSWDYTRGDKHYELRKSAADFSKLKSVLKLAYFCHNFAMDEQESYVLVAALKLNPDAQTAAELRARIKELPKVEGLEVPGDTAEPKPEPKPGPEEPKPEPLPPPTRKQAVVYIKMDTKDDTAETWMTDQFTKMNYKLGTEKDHEVKAQLDVKLTLVKNPEFMGAELYAIYDGELKWKLFKKGEKSAFAEKTVTVKDVRRDTRDLARAAARTSLCEETFTQIHDELEKLR
jgi:hypothetical protein